MCPKRVCDSMKIWIREVNKICVFDWEQFKIKLNSINGSFKEMQIRSQFKYTDVIVDVCNSKQRYYRAFSRWTTPRQRTVYR